MLDRTKRPSFISPKPVQISQPEEYSNSFIGIPDSSVDVCRIEILFPGGAYFNTSKGTSSLISNLFLEGTSKYTGQEIADKFAFWGSFVDFSSTAEYLKISLYSLKKYLQDSVDLLIHVFENSNFDENSILKKKAILKSKIAVQREKTSFEASLYFKEFLFNSTPYSNTTLEEDIDVITHNQISEFYRSNLLNKCIAIFINGSYSKEIVKQLENTFSPNFSNLKIKKFDILHQTTDFIKEKKDAIQSSIRIGCLTENRLSDNYPKNILLNEIFGGYFGSRLMKNIRENKGYTYGIHSSISHFNNISFFSIGTDVKKENRDDTFREIENEINILKTELISEEELTTVKNYIIGSFISSLNNSFDLLDKWKTIYLNDLSHSYYTQLQENLLELNSDDITNQANRFFENYNNFIKVSVG